MVAEVGPGIRIERDFDRALASSQIVMMLRIQAERLAGLHLDLDEYRRDYQLTAALGLCLRWLHGEWHLPLSRVLGLLTAQPAAPLGFKGRGTLAVGSFADVIVFDPDAEWTWRAADSRSRNSPFDGRTLRGRSYPPEEPGK